MPIPGQVWRHSRYYTDVDSGELMPKFLLVLTTHADGDVVFRLLTSRSHGRPQLPPCFHGDPLPGFYVGVPQPAGGPLYKETWLDLRECADFDSRDFSRLETSGGMTLVCSLSAAALCSALSCAANAPDTTRRQSLALLDERARQGCADH